MYGMSEYLMIMNELAKARLAERKRSEAGESSPSKGRESRTGRRARLLTRRR